MMTEPKSTDPARSVAGAEPEELARAQARIRDLEAALEAAQRKINELDKAVLPAEELRARSEDRFRALIENLHVGVVVQGPKSEILIYNDRALELLGLTEDEIFGRTSFDPSWEVIREDGAVYLPEERPVAVVLTTRAAVRGVVMGIRRPRTQDTVWLLVHALPEYDQNGEVVQVVATLDDISERKRLDASLHQTQKLDSLGLLAGGIAHDFNNLLTVITSCAELARLQMEPGAAAIEDIDEVLTAADRATSLTRQLLSFARRRAGDPRRIDVCDAVAQFEKLLSRLLRDDQELMFEPELGPIPVRIDQGQLEQVLVNFVVNARDAMPKGGRVTISVGRVGPGHAPGALSERAAALLSVRDTGIGMTPEVLDRVFEPFFTTKPAGHGTGLGLATVHGIVRQAGGEIHVQSTVGQGTEILVFLPLLADVDESAASRRQTGHGHGETVLVVDDDEVLRSVAARMLSDLGYRTIEAEDGFDALDKIEQRDGRIDVIVTDVVMPRMGGLELAQRVRERWPEVRIVATSGYAPQLGAEAESGDVDALLPKPFNMAKLGQCVQDVLEG